MKYKVTYWLNADFVAEEIIDEENQGPLSKARKINKATPWGQMGCKN